MDSFIRKLPRDSVAGEAVALQHDDRLRRGALVDATARVPYRHAFEVRHPSYFHDEFYDILRAHDCAFVIADTAGKFSYAEMITASFVYVRLHGSTVLYASDYGDDELESWAAKIRRWSSGRASRDVYVYFDNDAHAHAPFNAMHLAELAAARG
jgi:uncharacterized protein YecE (DUF72 family)